MEQHGQCVSCCLSVHISGRSIGSFVSCPFFWLLSVVSCTAITGMFCCTSCVLLLAVCYYLLFLVLLLLLFGTTLDYLSRKALGNDLSLRILYPPGPHFVGGVLLLGSFFEKFSCKIVFGWRIIGFISKFLRTSY